MLRKIHPFTTLMLVAIYLLTSTLTPAWSARKTRNSSTDNASTTDSAAINSAASNSYHAGMVVQKTGGNGTFIAKSGKNWVWMHTNLGAVDAYMDEQGVDSVEITADLLEEYVQGADGSGYWRLTFVFGPSGCFFTDPLRLELSGKYVSEGAEVWLFDEYGEALDGFSYAAGKKVIFEIDHFSRYSYDNYE